ncbi:Protein of uncharacterised function (DUF3558) [Mycobacteroides abscessus subsp. abscessus]|nr:Protein of uncharacterised function (DUF3558) [Mycobacteroides abscessus subsp. abscessus]
MAGQACIGAISAVSPDSGQLWLLPVYGAVCRSYSERCAYRKRVVNTMALHCITKVGVIVAALMTTSCAPIPGTPTRATVPTNIAGLPAIFHSPCEDIPEAVLREQNLHPSPVVTFTQFTRQGKESRTCTYRPVDRHYRVTVIASNDPLGKDLDFRPRQGPEPLTLGGRRAIRFTHTAPPGSSACEINLAAITGIFGVQVSAPGTDYVPFPDCPTAVLHYAGAFLPYFPF